MTVTNRTRRGRTTTRSTKRDSYGGDIATVDRMQEVWALRLRGYSFRAIGEKVGISYNTAWRDCQEPPDNLALMDDQSIARAQLLQGHRLLMDALMAEIEQQRQNGCITQEILADGSTKTKITRPDGRLIGEAGRCLDRAARLLGLLDGPLEGEPGGNGGGNTTINLIAPGSAAEFGTRAAELAAARQDAAITVQADPEAPQEQPKASTPPEAANEPPEPPEQPLVGWRTSRARRKAREAATGRSSGPRFLPQPQRN